MKPTVKLIFATVLVFQFNSTVFAQCGSSTGDATLDINNVSTQINVGDMWWDLTGSSRYEIPKGSGQNSLFAGALWIGGMDENTGNLKLAGQMYRQSGADYYPGPLDSLGNADANWCQQFDIGYSVTKAEILDFLLGNAPSQSILYWPGKGNVNGNIPNQELAPFIDVDNDGIYNPNQGDYPDIKGDQAIWMVFNDMGSFHFETGGAQIGIEVQQLIYGYATDDEINNATFYDYTIVKKSSGNLLDTYVGLFTDPDLGGSTDDFVASHSTKRLGIAYNSDGFDEDVNNTNGYGSLPPSVAVKYVRPIPDPAGQGVPMSSFMSISNDGSNSAMNSPSLASDYYNYMKGVWKDLSPAVQSGNGHTLGAPASEHYPYNYDIAHPNLNWSECSNSNQGGERKFIMGMGPFMLATGYETRFSSAVIWARDMDNAISCTNTDAIIDAADKVQSFIDTVENCPNALLYQTYIQDDNGAGTGEIQIALEPKYQDYQMIWSNGSQSNAISNLFSGNYQVVAHKNNCYFPLEFEVNTISGIQGINTKAASIYPNPSQGLLHIETELPGNKSIQIMDLAGRELKNQAMTESQTTIQWEEKGIYIIDVNNGQQSFKQKVIFN